MTIMRVKGLVDLSICGFPFSNNLQVPARIRNFSSSMRSSKLALFYNSIIGSDLVSWLHSHVIGLGDRRDARKYASVMLQAGLVRHTVSKHSFSEQCYYVFGDIAEENGKKLIL